MTDQFAMCHCGEPLIPTFAWRKQEFYCLECGTHYEFFGPSPGNPTRALEKRYETLKAEWDPIADRFIGGLASCSGPSWDGATDDQRADHLAALGQLRERAGLVTR